MALYPIVVSPRKHCERLQVVVADPKQPISSKNTPRKQRRLTQIVVAKILSVIYWLYWLLPPGSQLSIQKPSLRSSLPASLGPSRSHGHGRPWVFDSIADSPSCKSIHFRRENTVRCFRLSSRTQNSQNRRKTRRENNVGSSRMSSRQIFVNETPRQTAARLLTPTR